MSIEKISKTILIRHLIEKLRDEGLLEQSISVDKAVQLYEENKVDFNFNIFEKPNNYYEVFSGRYRTIAGVYTIDESGHVVKCIPKRKSTTTEMSER